MLDVGQHQGSMTGGTTGIFGYRNDTVRWPPVALALVMSGVLVGFIVGHTFPLAAVIVGLAGTAAYVGIWTCLVGSRLEVRDDRMYWYATLRSRTYSLNAIRGAETILPGLSLISVDGCMPFVVAASGRGWTQFLASLRARVDNESRFRPSAGSRVATSRAGGSRFNRYYEMQ
jgi:hypothetical protein